MTRACDFWFFNLGCLSESLLKARFCQVGGLSIAWEDNGCFAGLGPGCLGLVGHRVLMGHQNVWFIGYRVLPLLVDLV